MRRQATIGLYVIALAVFGCGSESRSGSAGTPLGNGGSGAGGNGGGVGTLVGSCRIFPADNPWNRDVANDPLAPNSDAIIATIQGSGGTKLHPDFGSNLSYGIPYVVVPGTQPLVDVTFAYADESDPGPYPIPPDAPIEGGATAGGDRHVLVVDKDHCKLYETYDSHYVAPQWQCGSGAVFDLESDALRPDCWTSADAAGLPIFPGLVRIDEVLAGKIEHAIRVTFSATRQAFVRPATHFASSQTGDTYPPMGMRLRLKASFDRSGFTGQSRVILDALARYGFIVADNGSNWFFQGASDPQFNDDDLSQLKNVPGDAFEVVAWDRLYTPVDCP